MRAQGAGRRPSAGDIRANLDAGLGAGLGTRAEPPVRTRERVQVLARVVDVIDAPNATVRLRPEMEQVDAEMAAVRSRVTVRWRRTP